MLKQNWRSLLLILLALVSLASCFTPEEVEIFQLQKEINTKYGEEIDFYQFLKLPKLKDSNSKEIVKNFRRLSKKYHPDKNRKYKKLYERLNLVSQILTNDSRRKTYDYYLKNGFPDYDFTKGGFFFKRVQPKTWFILAFIYVACGLIHLVLLRLQNNGNKTRIKSFIRDVKEQDDTNGLGEKRLIFKQSADDEAGKEILVRFGDVYAVQADGSEASISVDDIKEPGLRDSMLVRLPAWIWKCTLGRFIVSNKDTASDLTTQDKDKEATSTKKKTLKPKSKGHKMKLPNGKVVHSRPKKD